MGVEAFTDGEGQVHKAASVFYRHRWNSDDDAERVAGAVVACWDINVNLVVPGVDRGV